MTALERARRAARACSRGRASPRNVEIIRQEIEAHAAGAVSEEIEAALDRLYVIGETVATAAAALSRRRKRLVAGE